MDVARPVESMIPGAQGRILAVLAETTAELSLRTVARLAHVSVAQTSRVLPGLVELGVVERREVPPTSLFRLVPGHVAARAVLALARSADTALTELAQVAATSPHPPDAVVVFGSFARRTATAGSDIDLAVVRPADVDADDPDWDATVDALRRAARTLTGNRVDVLEVGAADLPARLAAGGVWDDICREGRVVHGLPLDRVVAVRDE